MLKRSVFLAITSLSALVFGITVFGFGDVPPKEAYTQIKLNKDKYEPGSLLTHDDFKTIDNIACSNYDDALLTDQYDNNMLDYINATIGGDVVDRIIYFSIYMDEDDKYDINTSSTVESGGDAEESLIGNNETYWYSFRGIGGAAKKEDVITQYGVGVYGRFDQTTDLLYSYLNDDEDDEEEKAYLVDHVFSYLLYNYQDAGQLVFYFDDNDELFALVFSNGLDMAPPESCVRDVQFYLNQNGYDSGEPDGKLGPNTEAAITRYREDHGISVNGRVDDELLKCIENEKNSTGL